MSMADLSENRISSKSPPPGSGAVRLDDFLNPPPPTPSPAPLAFEAEVDRVIQIRGLPRLEAEHAAFENILVAHLNRTFSDTRSDRCAHCGRAEEPSSTLLPIGVGVRHTWLHRDCWEPWRAHRRTEAIGQLAATGIATKRPAKRCRCRRDGSADERLSAREPLNAPAPLILGVDEARVRIERARIARWVAAQIVSYPPDRCLCCRRPIVFGAKWVELVNDDTRARFHFDCAPVWRAQQEMLARRALGFDRKETAP